MDLCVEQSRKLRLVAKVHCTCPVESLFCQWREHGINYLGRAGLMLAMSANSKTFGFDANFRCSKKRQ